MKHSMHPLASALAVSLLGAGFACSDSVDPGGAAPEDSVSSGTIPPSASDYAISFAPLEVRKDADHLVETVEGYAELTAGGIEGETYAIVAAALDASTPLATIVTTFNTPEQRIAYGLLADLNPPLQLAASSFGLAGLDLDDVPVRTVIIEHTADGVPSYQLVKVTFTP